MLLQIETLLICDALVTGIIGAALIFYATHQRTYPGFNYWALGTMCAAFGYVAILLRFVLPLGVSVFLAHTLLAAAGLLRYAAARLFMRSRSLPKLYLALPPLHLLVVLYFTFAQPDVIIRNLSISIFLAITCELMAYEFACFAPPGNRAVYLAMSGVMILFSVSVLVRAVSWVFLPQYSFFDPHFLQVIHFLLMILFEVCWGGVFLMMNAQRTEAALQLSHAALEENVAALETAIAEVSTLSGLLPICAHCKKIRNDQGYWTKLEHYLTDHTEAQFSHGLCPDCAQELYPDHLD